MRQVICPVCTTPPNQPIDRLRKVCCSGCSVMWTYLPEDLDSAALYRDEVYALVDNRKSIFEKIIFSEAKKVLNRAKKLNPQAKRLLDFGSGKGQFLAVAKDLGWKVSGIETEPARADFAKEKYGVDVICSYYEGGSIGSDQADLISLNHVLEHLPQPISLLDQLIQSNLAPSGLLYIEVPRSDSWQAKIAGEGWIHWDIPKHLSHWSESVLIAQLRNLGFEPVGKRNFSVHLGVLGMLQAILSRFGFRENLILRLKRKKSVGLLLAIAVLLPFSWIAEAISAQFGKSGILGVYFRKHE